MSGKEQWDGSYDLIVVGTGNGGLTAALCAREFGLRDVLVIEKADRYGGTSSLSGGGVWIPGNRYAAAAGAEDTLEEAHRYLRQLIDEDDVAEEKLWAFLENGPKMIDFLHERTRVRYRSLAHYPDYYTNLEGAREGHRSLEPEPFPASELGDAWRRLRRSHPMMHLGGVIGFTQEEAATLMGQQPGWWKIALRLGAAYLADIPWRLRDRYHRRLTTGCAGVARLLASLQDRDIPVWLEAPMEQLLTRGDAVTGVQVRRGDRSLRLQARRGVILAAGGFEHNQQLRERYLPAPTDHRWSAGVAENTGDAIEEGMRLGAATHRLGEAWWCNTLSVPGEAIPRLAIMEKSYPGSIVVNRAGRRFGNESQNYLAFQLETFRRHSEDNPCHPAWQIFDGAFRARYIVGPLYNSRLRPDWLLPRRYEEAGFLTRADTLRELAEKTGMDAAGLEETVAAMNRYAANGVDEAFARGESAYDRYYGDPRVTPNPCLAPLETPPYYALRINPGDFGTQGGLVTDAGARVLRPDGSAIDGLYAIGNCSAPVLPCYPGPGATLGPAMTFGYLAARAAAGADP